MVETKEIAQDVARKIIESYIEHGDPIPRQDGPCGRIFQESPQYLQGLRENTERPETVEVGVNVLSAVNAIKMLKVTRQRFNKPFAFIANIPEKPLDFPASCSFDHRR